MNANFADGSNGTGLSIGYRTDETTAVLASRTATGNIAFYSYNGGWSESMRIQNDGNVGIGTTTPSAKLDVQGSLGQLFSVTDNLTGSLFAVSDISGVPIFDVNSSGAISFNGTTNYGAVGDTLTSNGNAAPTWQSGGSSPWTTSGSNISFSGVPAGNGGTVGIITSGSNPAELYFNNAANNYGNNFSIRYQQSGGSNWNYDPLLTFKHKNSSFWFFGSSGSSTPKTVIQHQQGGGMPSSNNMDKGMLQLAGEQYGGNYPPLTIQKGTNGNSSGYMAGFKETSGAGYGGILRFFSNSNQNRGGIRFNSSQTGVTFDTSSDYRLKEDLQDFKGLDMVSKIPVYDFKWKTYEDRSYGVMAHELQEVLPEAVSGKKDALNNEGEIEPQQVDYSKIVPLLIKSIQELKAEIEILKNK
jgi:hypothetical protein